MLNEKSHYKHSIIQELGSFEAYIKWRCEHEIRFQKDFIYSQKGELLVDFVGRFEQLETDFATICTQIGINASLPKLNASYSKKPYQEYYTPFTRSLVYQSYETDIKLFEYEY